MKKVKILTFFFVIIVITSCQYGVDFEVKNKTRNNIDSLVITNGFNYLKLYNIKFNEGKEGFLDFKENNPKHDGLYNLELFMQNSIRKKSFGYYSNGGPNNSGFKLIIENDTIIINELF